MRGFSPLELLLQAVFVEPLQLLHALADAVGALRVRPRRQVRHSLVLLRCPPRVGEVVEALGLTLRVAVEFQLLLDDLFEILVVGVVLVAALLCVPKGVPSSLRFLSA